MLTLPGDLFYGGRSGYTPPTLGSGYGGDFRPTLPPNFTTPDLNALHADTLRSKLAHAALIQGQQSQADSDNQLLQSATPEELSNIYGAPRSAREARIQQIIQADSAAKDRGTQLIPTWKTMQEYNHGLLQNEQLKNQIYSGNQDRQLKPKEFQLQLDQFGNTKAFQSQEHQDKQAALALDQQKANSESAYKNWLQTHQTQQDKVTQERLANADFAQLQKSVASGEIPAEAIISAQPNLTPAQQAVLRAHQGAFEQNAQQAAQMAESWNQKMQKGLASLPQPTAAVPWSWTNPLTLPKSAQPGATPEDIDQTMNNVITQFQHDKTAPKMVTFDAESGRFVPILKLQPRATSTGSSGASYDPVPAWLRTNQLTGVPNYDTPSGPLPDAPGVGNSNDFIGPPEAPSASPFQSYSTGSVPRLGNYPIGNYASSPGAPRYLQGQDGFLYQVINGVPVKTNLRRR